MKKSVAVVSVFAMTAALGFASSALAQTPSYIALSVVNNHNQPDSMSVALQGDALPAGLAYQGQNSLFGHTLKYTQGGTAVLINAKNDPVNLNYVITYHGGAPLNGLTCNVNIGYNGGAYTATHTGQTVNIGTASSPLNVSVCDLLTFNSNQAGVTYSYDATFNGLSDQGKK